MTILIRAAVLLVFVLVGTAASAQEAPASLVRVSASLDQPRQQEEFLPIDQLPPQDVLPAAPLLIGAYAFVLVMLFGYVVSVSRRLSVIQHEVDRLEADLKRSAKG